MNETTWKITLNKYGKNNDQLISQLINGVKNMEPVSLLDKEWLVKEVKVKPYAYTFYLVQHQMSML